MSLKQWVNLTKDEAFTKDGDGSTLERCGKITIEVLFLKDDVPISFKVKVSPVGSDNVVYTKKEKKRNTNFKLTQGTLGLSDKKNVLLEESIQLPAAGGNKYKIEAKDANGKVASTTMEIETKRKLYYQTISMDDKKGNKVPKYSLSNMEKHSKKHHIDLIKKGSHRKIPYTKTITDANASLFAEEIKKVFNIDSRLKKLGVAAVFSDYIADPTERTINRSVTMGTVDPRCSWNSSEMVVTGNAFL
jgi:hypothetical protein